MTRALPIVVALTLALAAAACKGNDSSTSSTTSPTTTTDTFNGTVQPQGSTNHSFTVNASGQVAVTLTAAGPPSTIAMGIGIGTPANGACGVITGGSTTTSAGTTAQLTGIVSPGTLCVAIFDVGNQTAAVNYTVTVAHP